MTLCSKKTISLVSSLTLALVLSACGKSLVRRDSATDNDPSNPNAGSGRGLLTDIGLDGFQGDSSSQFDPVLKVLSLSGQNLPGLVGAVQSPLLDLTREKLVAIAVLPQQPYNKEFPALNLADSGYPTGNFNAADMVGYYRLNESSAGPVLDSSKNGRHGTSGNMPVSVPGILRGALKFDGAKNVIVNAMPDATDSLNLKRYTVGGTWMAWFSNDTPIDGADLVRKGANGDYTITYNKTATTSTVSCTIFNLNQTRRQATFSVPAVTGWLHVGCTYDGATLKAYFNGVLVSSTATTIGIGATGTNKNLYLGGLNKKYKGSLDEVAIFSRPFSAEEIGLAVSRGEVFGVQYRAAATPQELQTKPYVGPGGPDTYYLPVGVDSLNPPVFGVSADGLYVQVKIRYALRGSSSRVVIRNVKPIYQSN